MKTIFIGGFSLFSILALGQQPTNHLPNAGWCGVGTRAVSNSHTPVQNLQIHGSTPYRRESRGESTPGSGELELEERPVPVFIDYGVTSAISLTNTVTGATVSDGAILRMSEKHFTIDNLEPDGNIILATNGANMVFNASQKAVYTGGSFSVNNQVAKFNIFGDNSNGLNIRTIGSNAGYALSIQARNISKAIMVYGDENTKNFEVSATGNVFGRKLDILSPNNVAAIEVLNTDNQRNFKVSGSGEVFGRKFTTTLQNIPDYVFEKNYPLMPLNELKSYIATNKHLPNIPSAEEIEAANGEVDLGEMNRLLLEKVEESMLYILQLEERIKALEEKK
jgi:hypothetical protein